MKYTGVFATEEERKELQELANEAARTPVITLRSDMPSFSATAWKHVHDRVYAVALSKGLPEIEGYYGMNFEGEFLTI
jgi:GTP:adenosylcobinamide-phosphate guanylyltransferase